MRSYVCYGSSYYGGPNSRRSYQGMAKMILLVCGGRDYADYETVCWALEPYLPFPVTQLLLVQGGALGADALAKRWAQERGVAVAEYPANWDYFGKAAGPVRNNTMLRWAKPDVVVAFPGGRGTDHMVKRARAIGVNIVEIGLSGASK